MATAARLLGCSAPSLSTLYSISLFSFSLSLLALSLSLPAHGAERVVLLEESEEGGDRGSSAAGRAGARPRKRAVELEPGDAFDGGGARSAAAPPAKKRSSPKGTRQGSDQGPSGAARLSGDASEAGAPEAPSGGAKADPKGKATGGGPRKPWHAGSDDGPEDANGIRFSEGLYRLLLQLPGLGAIAGPLSQLQRFTMEVRKCTDCRAIRRLCSVHVVLLGGRYPDSASRSGQALTRKALAASADSSPSAGPPTAVATGEAAAASSSGPGSGAARLTPAPGKPVAVKGGVAHAQSTAKSRVQAQVARLVEATDEERRAPKASPDKDKNKDKDKDRENTDKDKHGSRVRAHGPPLPLPFPLPLPPLPSVLLPLLLRP